MVPWRKAAIAISVKMVNVVVVVDAVVALLSEPVDPLSSYLSLHSTLSSLMLSPLTAS